MIRATLSLSLFFLLLYLPACETRRDTSQEPANIAVQLSPPTMTTKSPFREAMEPILYELPSGALATWRDFAPLKPALILFSSHPLLLPLYEEDRRDIRNLILNAPHQEIVRRSRLWSADPLFLPPQTISAAIDAGLFSELIFVFPTDKNGEEVSLAAFRNQAMAAGFLTKSEAQALTLNEGIISGSVRKTPLRVAHPLRLPKLLKPTIIHLDLSYFEKLYINEIKTPVYDLIHATILDIKDAAPPTLAVTLSYSNQEATYGLESRFMINDLAAILRNPQYLDTTAPASWSLRASSFYFATMFSESKADELTLQAAKANPDDPAALFNLAVLHLKQKRSAEGFAALDKAVALDRGYALAYLDLAMNGRAMGEKEKSIELLRKATEAWPENSISRVDLAYLLLENDHRKEAAALLQELKKLPWSVNLHPQIPGFLNALSDAAQSDAPVLRLPDPPNQESSLVAPAKQTPPRGQ